MSSFGCFPQKDMATYDLGFWGLELDQRKAEPPRLELLA